MLTIKQNSEIIYSDNMLHLKRIAWMSFVLQYWAAIIYLFFFFIFPESNDAAVSCGIMAILIAISPAFYALYNKQFLVIFSCISAFNIAPVWFLYLEAVLPGYDAYMYITPGLRMEALFWIALFFMFVNLLYVLCWDHIIRYSIKVFSLLKSINVTSGFYQQATVLCFVLPLIAFYFFYKSLDVMWVGLTAGRAGEEVVKESTGTLGGMFVPLTAIWQLTPILGAIAFITSANKLNLRTILCLVLGLIICFISFLSGSRGMMMFTIAPLVFFVFYYNWDKGLKFWITILTVLFVFIGIMELQVRFRGNLLDVITDPGRAAQERGLASATTFDPTESHRDNNMYLLCLMVQGYPKRYPFQGFGDFFTTLVNPIPRAIWPDKPLLIGAKDISQQPAFALDGPIIMGTTSLSYSVVGDAYQSEGALGLFVYALLYSAFLLFFDGVSYYTHRDRPLSIGVFGLGVFLAFWGVRGFFALVSFLYPMIFFILLLKVMQIYKSNENHIHRA